MLRERRKHIRVEWNSPAMIYEGDGSLGQPCVVSNLCNDGARITQVDPDRISDVCMLRVSPRSRLRKCNVVWRSKEAVGLQFAEPLPDIKALPARELAPEFN
jgi:PilZ domain